MKKLLTLLALAFPTSAQANIQTSAMQRVERMGTVISEKIEHAERTTTFRYKGGFIDRQAHVPYGRKSPTGTRLTLVYDNRTGRLIALHLTGKHFKVPKPKGSFGGCSSLSHCYAIIMDVLGGWEVVSGGMNVVANVPDWGSGGFIDAEAWTAFVYTTHPVEYWVEGGLTVGEYMDCCTPHEFEAFQNAAGYSQWVDPEPYTGEVSISAQSWNEPPSVWLMRVSETSCYSCVEERYGNETVSGLPRYAEEEQIGVEVATETPPTFTATSTMSWTMNHFWALQDWNGQWEPMKIDGIIHQLGSISDPSGTLQINN